MNQHSNSINKHSVEQLNQNEIGRKLPSKSWVQKVKFVLVSSMVLSLGCIEFFVAYLVNYTLIGNTWGPSMHEHGIFGYSATIYFVAIWFTFSASPFILLIGLLPASVWGYLVYRMHKTMYTNTDPIYVLGYIATIVAGGIPFVVCYLFRQDIMFIFHVLLCYSGFTIWAMNWVLIWIFYFSPLKNTFSSKKNRSWIIWLCWLVIIHVVQYFVISWADITLFS